MSVSSYGSGSNSRPGSGSSRPSSITRSSRNSFIPEMELLPPENVILNVVLAEDVDKELYVEDMYETEDSVEAEIADTEDQETSSEKTDLVSEEESKANKEKGEEEEEIDPRIQKGMKRIKKLDKILAKKTEREKEVKNERRALEREFHMQVKELINEKGIEKVCGSQQLLSLCVSTDRCDQGIEDDVNPIFTTQIDTDFYHKELQEEESDDAVDNNTSGQDSASVKGSSRRQKTNKDYIKRNIQLASQANDVIPLTEEERKRLDELLADDSDLLLIHNPFSTPVIDTNGYKYSIEQQKALEEIDSKLKDLIPDDEYELIGMESCRSDITLPLIKTGSSDTSITAHTDSQRSTMNDNKQAGDLSVTASSSFIELIVENNVACGETVLQSERDNREIMSRLNAIETQLSNLQLTSNEENSSIDPDLLRRLLDVDSRLTSTSKNICDSVQSVDMFDLNSVIGSSTQSISELDTARSLISNEN